MEILQFGTPSNLSTNNITDLNADNPTGFYASNSAANSPIAGAHFLYVINRLNATANYQQQFASRISDNSQLWYRMLSVDGVLEGWRTVAIENSASWTPTVGGSLTNGSTPGYTNQLGRAVQHSNLININFKVTGTLGATAPTGSPVIRGLPFTARNDANLIWSNFAFRTSMGGTEGISGLPLWFIKGNENFVRLGLQDAGLNGNPAAEGNLWNYRGSSSFDFQGNLIYEING